MTPAWRVQRGCSTARSWACAARPRLPARTGRCAPARWARRARPRACRRRTRGAAARCPPPPRAARGARARRSRGASSGTSERAAPLDAATTRSARASSPGPKLTSARSPRPPQLARELRRRAPPARACSPSRRRGSAPRSRRQPRPCRNASTRATASAENGSGNSRSPTASMPSGSQQRQVLVDHVAAADAGDGLAQQPRRARLAPRGPLPADHARRPREPRPGGRLPEPLEVERGVVAARAQRGDRRERPHPVEGAARRRQRSPGRAAGSARAARRDGGSTTQPVSQPARCSAASAGSVWTTSPIDERRTRSAFTRGSSR